MQIYWMYPFEIRVNYSNGVQTNFTTFITIQSVFEHKGVEWKREEDREIGSNNCHPLAILLYALIIRMQDMQELCQNRNYL